MATDRSSTSRVTCNRSPISCSGTCRPLKAKLELCDRTNNPARDAESRRSHPSCRRREFLCRVATFIAQPKHGDRLQRWRCPCRRRSRGSGTPPRESNGDVDRCRHHADARDPPAAGGRGTCSSPRRPGRRGGRVRISSSSVTSASADAGRTAGDLARHLRHQSAGRVRALLDGESRRWPAPELRELYHHLLRSGTGIRATAHQDLIRDRPKAYRSTRSSAAGCKPRPVPVPCTRACRGRVIVVNWCSPVAALSALATPKSITIAWRPDTMMFSGLMSRCTTPRS